MVPVQIYSDRGALTIGILGEKESIGVMEYGSVEKLNQPFLYDLHHRFTHGSHVKFRVDITNM